MIKILAIIFSIILSVKSVAIENKILFKIDGEIITTADINNEANYLKILNKNMNSLEQNQIFEISKNSLIRDKIKKNEILKFIKEIKIDNEIMEKLIKSSYQKSGLSSKAQFIQILKEKNLRYSYVENKLSINALWNQFIYEKFASKIKINNKEIRDNIIKEGSFIKKFLLSEIVFDLNKNSNLEKKYSQIEESIKINGFENTANLYSISNSSKVGGKIGWVKKNNLSLEINRELEGLKINSYSEPIKIDNNYLILKINDIKEIAVKIDKEKELDKMIMIETSKQLDKFSNIFYNKIKLNSVISEF